MSKLAKLFKIYNSYFNLTQMLQRVGDIRINPVYIYNFTIYFFLYIKNI